MQEDHGFMVTLNVADDEGELNLSLLRPSNCKSRHWATWTSDVILIFFFLSTVSTVPFVVEASELSNAQTEAKT
jgi:hypothetical protein